MFNDKTVEVNDTTLNYSFTKDMLIMGPDLPRKSSQMLGYFNEAV